MQRKPGFPVNNCNIKIPDSIPLHESVTCEEEGDQQHRRQQLINFAHSQWGFNNWSWSVTKQDLDFTDFSNGKYCAGVVAFVSITVKSFDIHRENIGYATSMAPMKGLAIYQARKCAVTNALRETLLSFGGSVATELLELLETHKTENNPSNTTGEHVDNNQNIANKLAEPKNSPLNNIRKDSSESNSSNPVRQPVVNNTMLIGAPVTKAPVNLPPPANRGPPRVPPPGPVAHMHVPSPVGHGPTPVVHGPTPVVHGPAPAGHGPTPAGHGPTIPGHAPTAPGYARPNSNDDSTKPADVDEEARAERKRRQRQAQEEFRLKQMMKQKTGDDQQEMNKNSSSFDQLIMEIPTQDILIEESCRPSDEVGKRPAPTHDTSSAKRRASVNRLDIVQAI